MDQALEASALELRHSPSSGIASSKTNKTVNSLSFVTKLLYAAPNLAAGATTIPLLITMPKFYADVVAVPLSYLAIAIAITRCLDAIIDPAIGFISDRTHSRWGRRRPYIFVGAPLGGLALWALMNPPVYLSSYGGVVWYTVFSMLCSLFLTLALLPYYALGAELSLDYSERNSLFGAREGFGVLGTLIAAAAPGLLMQRLGWSDRAVFSRLGLAFMLGLVACCWLMVLSVRERSGFASGESNSFVPGVRRALRNRPFNILLASYVALGVSFGIGQILLPFYVAYVIQPTQPALWVSIFLVAYLGIGFLFIPIGVAVARRFGKRSTFIGCYLIGVCIDLVVFWFVGKGQTVLYLILVSLHATTYGAGLFLPFSMQADVIDYDELHTGRRREAQYAGFWSILFKLAAIPSAALPIALLASLGYVSNALKLIKSSWRFAS